MVADGRRPASSVRTSRGWRAGVGSSGGCGVGPGPGPGPGRGRWRAAGGSGASVGWRGRLGRRCRRPVPRPRRRASTAVRARRSCRCRVGRGGSVERPRTDAKGGSPVRVPPGAQAGPACRGPRGCGGEKLGRPAVRKGCQWCIAQREADEAQIKEQVARIAEGIRAKDLEGLRPIYATDVVSFDVEPPLQHVGVEAKLKNWANVFAVLPGRGLRGAWPGGRGGR